ncbi:hypothetical protein M9458_041308, partial [Cirrhinus mrigala]
SCLPGSSCSMSLLFPPWLLPPLSPPWTLFLVLLVSGLHPNLHKYCLPAFLPAQHKVAPSMRTSAEPTLRQTPQETF